MLRAVGVATVFLSLGVGLVLSPATASAFQGLAGAGHITGGGHFVPRPFAAPSGAFRRAGPPGLRFRTCV